MFGLDFKHVIDENGDVSLEYFKYTDIDGTVLCEMADGKIVWHVKPVDVYLKIMVEARYKEIMRDWYLDRYIKGMGIDLHEIPFEDWIREGKENANKVWQC